MGNNPAILGKPDPNQPAINRPDYGAFSGVADIEQALKDTLRQSPNWRKLTSAQKTAFEMIMHKTARLLNGNPNHIDSWHDIAGYATLVENNLRGTGPV